MKQNKCIALGFFDGIHLGHKALFEKVKSYGGESMVLTFDCHPHSYLGKDSVPLLSSQENRDWLCRELYGIHRVIVAPFGELCQLPPDRFVRDYLHQKLNITHVVAGHDYRFGKDGCGDVAKLQDLCQELGIVWDIIPPVRVEGELVSSTTIRKLLQEGNLSHANTLLGHPHILSNQVIHGNKIGREVLGFPTVNLSVPEGILTPAFGVYACRVWVGERVFSAVTNVGIRPTVTEEDKSVTVESFLLDFSGEELYGQGLRVEFHHFLRPERKFADFSALSAQIARDVEEGRRYFSVSP